ncbi:MAG: hypothetical protein KUG77_12500 [Nannocystaceae bacterium]|nr:hypothetical protein [Nannocystaceae bacterium]
MRRLLGLILPLLACRPEPVPIAAPPTPYRRDLQLTEAQSRALGVLAAEADAHPADAAKLKRSGMAHMRFTLSGVLPLRDRAEQDLEAAFTLDPTDKQLTRTLGRFYNLRAVGGDDTKARMQARVYAAHLGEVSVDQLPTAEFVAYSFSRLGAILSDRNRGQLVGALSKIKALEAELRAATLRDPSDLELKALAGNFAFFFAGNVPFGRRSRVEAAVGYFEPLRAHWTELRRGARHPGECPNTYENFMFELAEGYTVLERLDEAREVYGELSQVRAPRTRAKEQVAYISVERLRNLERYAGEMDLMPPWPSDVGNCVVCHSYGADVPMTSLYAIEPISLDDIPRGRVAPKSAPLPRR